MLKYNTFSAFIGIKTASYLGNAGLNNETVTPVRPWIVANPLADVSISNYGAKKKSWEALTEDHLHHLFSLSNAW